jgi:signal transduction histidine kinase
MNAPRLHPLVSRALDCAGQTAQALENLRAQLESLGQQRRAPLFLAWAACIHARILSKQGRPEEALVASHRAEHLAGARPSTTLQAHIHRVRAQASAELGRWQDHSALLLVALECVRRGGDPLGEVEVLNPLGFGMTVSGRTELAIPVLEQSRLLGARLASTRRTHRSRVVAARIIASGNLAAALLEQIKARVDAGSISAEERDRQVERATAIAIEGRDLARTACHTMVSAGPSDTITELALLRGDLVLAKSAAQEALRAAQGAGPVVAVLVHAMAARVALAAGHPAKAMDLIAHVGPLVEKMPDDGQAALRYLRVLGDASAARGDWQRAALARGRLNDAQCRVWECQRTQRDSSLLRQFHCEREDAVRFLSHDLRLALAAAMNSADRLHQRWPADDVTKPVSPLRSGLSRALRMSESFIAELQSSNIDEARFAAVEMAELVDDACEHLKVSAAPKGLSMSTRIGARARRSGVWVQGSRQYLHRALINILDNAARVTRDGARVSVTLEVRAGFCCVAVRDEGPGFDIVANADPHGSADSTGIDGHGFGLRLVRRVVGAHHGMLRIANRTRQGAIVEMLIPLRAAGAPTCSA